MAWVGPVRLEGEHVILRQASWDDFDDLFHAGNHPELWRWTLEDASASREAMRAYWQEAFSAMDNGAAMPFAQIDRSTGQIVGSTRYGEIDEAHRTLEIGWTWITPDFQRTPLNTEAKFLLLRHAFESLGALRVQLKTDERNERSKAAILRIGATYEGTLRNHKISQHGFNRRTAMFSIIATEWPGVKEHLLKLLH